MTLLPCQEQASAALRANGSEAAMRCAAAIESDPSPDTVLDVLMFARHAEIPAAAHYLHVLGAAVTKAEEPNGPRGG